MAIDDFDKHLHIQMIVQEHQSRLLYQNPNYKVSQAKKNEQYYIPIHMNHTHAPPLLLA
jgi:hypothetical protein